MRFHNPTLTLAKKQIADTPVHVSLSSEVVPSLRTRAATPRNQVHMAEKEIDVSSSQDLISHPLGKHRGQIDHNWELERQRSRWTGARAGMQINLNISQSATLKFRHRAGHGGLPPQVQFSRLRFAKKDLPLHRSKELNTPSHLELTTS